MDKIDRQLLKILHQNARISIVELSKMINLSRPSVKERLDKLIEQGVIKNFSIHLAHNKVEQQIVFFTELSNVTLPIEKVHTILKNCPNVIELHIVSGEVNYIVKSAVKTTAEMKNLLASWMSFATIRSTIILDTLFENRLNIGENNDDY